MPKNKHSRQPSRQGLVKFLVTLNNDRVSIGVTRPRGLVTENPRVTSSSLVPGIQDETPRSVSYWGFFNSPKTPFQRFEGCKLGVNLPPRWTFLDGFGQFIGVKLG